MKLEIKHLAPYLSYGLEFYIHSERKIFKAIGLKNDIILFNEKHFQWAFFNDKNKPILRPMSDLVKDINWGLQACSFIDLFEIGDTGGCIWEFDYGNIKTIQKLKTISKYNIIHDIDYLPHAVVQLMFEYNFDVFGLIDAGLAIDINTVPELLNG